MKKKIQKCLNLRAKKPEAMRRLMCFLFGHKWQKNAAFFDMYGVWVTFKCKRCGKNIKKTAN